MFIKPIYYFAYGSNMDPEQMYKRCPDSKKIGPAVLQDHKIAFTRYSLKRKSGVADILVTPGSQVWGILYEVSASDLKSLDRYEGKKANAYKREAQDVYFYNEPDHLFNEVLYNWENEESRELRINASFNDPANFTKYIAEIYEVVTKDLSCFPSLAYLRPMQDAAFENGFPGLYQMELAIHGKKHSEKLNAAAIDLICTYMKMIENDQWPAEVAKEREWAGAELVITGDPERKAQLNREYPLDLVVLTPNWQKLSWLLRNIYHDKSINWQIDYLSKYKILDELGQAILEYQDKYPGHDLKGECMALVTKVYSIFV